MKRFLKILGIVFASVILLVGLFFGYLTLFEYRPKKIEVLKVENLVHKNIELNRTYTALTFNIGYASLGIDEDFVMDGGKKGKTDNLSVMTGYLNGIKNILKERNADIYLIQEVDLKARRSYYVNEVAEIFNTLGNSYNSTFAYNFKAQFVPFPLSFTDYIGYVKGGLQTLSRFTFVHAERQQFPGSFAWPLRIANLKRAMVTHELHISGSDKKLIVVNLHMSAYDGDGSLRTKEMEFLKSFLIDQNKRGNYVLVGGDFNQTFPDAIGIYPPIQDIWIAYEMEKDFLPEGYTTAIDTTLPSCRLLNKPYDSKDPTTQYYIIDGFIVSNNITVESVLNLNHGFLYSDHNPIQLQFRLQASTQ